MCPVNSYLRACYIMVILVQFLSKYDMIKYLES